MMTEGECKMSAAKQKPSSIDWARAQAQAFAALRSPRAGKKTVPQAEMRFAHDSYWSEPLQQAALRAVDLWRSGKEEPPQTTEALAASLARHARFIDDNRRLRERTRTRSLTRNAERAARNFCGAEAVDVLDELCARELFDVLLQRLFDIPDPDMPRLLDAWLCQGIDYDDNAGFANRLGLGSPQAAHNIKRRIKYHAHKIMADLSGRDEGELS
jgi:hypothetical protein